MGGLLISLVLSQTTGTKETSALHPDVRRRATWHSNCDAELPRKSLLPPAERRPSQGVWSASPPHRVHQAPEGRADAGGGRLKPSAGERELYQQEPRTAGSMGASSSVGASPPLRFRSTTSLARTSLLQKALTEARLQCFFVWMSRQEPTRPWMQHTGISLRNSFRAPDTDP